MRLKVFTEILLINIRSKIAKLLFQYMQYKYGKKADVCVVSAKNGKVLYSTSVINGIEDSTICGTKLNAIIRSKCGQQMLNTYGLTPPGKEIPVLALMPTPALLKTIGVSNFIDFINDWPGESKIGEATVIKYILWKEIDNEL